MVVVSLPFIGLMTGAETGISSDLRDYHLPLFRWVWRTVGDGHAPFWAPWAFGGQNVPGIGQGAIWYPPNAVFGLLDVVTAYRWWTMFHLWLATSGAFVWAWRRWASAPAAAVAAVVYGLNGALVLHLIHANFTIVSAWLPWLCLTLDRLLERRDARSWVAYSLVLALIGFAGHPQVLLAALIAITFIGVASLARRGVGVRPWLHLAGATALGLALSAVQLLPQLLFSRTSVRSSLSASNSFQENADLGDLLTALVPHLGRSGIPGTSGHWFGSELGHETSNHLGAVAIALAVIAVAARWRDRRVVGLGLLSLFGFVVALGDGTPLGPIAYRIIPLADRFRIWPRYLILSNLAVACLAALGVTVVLGAPQRWRRALLVATGAVALLGPWAVVAATRDAPFRLSVGDVVVPVAIAALALLALWAAAGVAGNRPTAAVAIIVASCAIPAALFTLSAPWRHDAISPAAADAFFDEGARTSAPFDAPGGVDRWMSRHGDLRAIERVQQTARVDGYEPLLQADFAAITGAVYIGGVLPDQPMFTGWMPDVLRITTVVLHPEDIDPGQRWTRDGSLGDTSLERWSTTPRLPEVAVLGAVRVLPFDEVVAALQSDRGDLTTTVMIEDDAAGLPALRTRATPGVAGSADGSMSADGSGHFTVQADRDAVLVVSTGWLDGWTATVDGRSVPIARANGLVLAVPVHAGTNDVRLEFTPPGLVSGAAVSGAAALTLMSIGVVPAVRRRRRSAGEPDEPGEPNTPTEVVEDA